LDALQYPEIFVPLRQTLFWKQPEVISSHIRGTGWVIQFTNRFLGQKLLDRERLVSWNTVMVEIPIVEPKFMPFYMQQLHITASVFPHNKVG
jgi:hypothetical protein